jgi:N-acetylglucosamine kinase-like BadF-type ATPase
MAPYAGTTSPEAEANRAAITALVDGLRTDIHRILDDLKTTADQLLDRSLAQVTWARETLERTAPLVDECLTQGDAAAGAVLEQARRAVPHLAAAHQRPWVVLGSALLVGYLVCGARSRAPAAPARLGRPATSPASSQP